ncbi:MAG: hypothetical protein Ct9H300mP32_6420 [Verrucomicrobiota bacterium]|nr:MAG: hypothetical protein Ct9H300mP32_6420 [Verrucomicrobiota bacterium]
MRRAKKIYEIRLDKRVEARKGVFLLANNHGAAIAVLLPNPFWAKLGNVVAEPYNDSPLSKTMCGLASAACRLAQPNESPAASTTKRVNEFIRQFVNPQKRGDQDSR